MKNTKIRTKLTIKEVDDLWAEVVKARAGYVSEYSGKQDRLNSHHIAGKPNYRLRWELKNGICITRGEHKWVAHHSGRSQKFRRFALNLRGFTEDEISVLECQLGGTDKFLVFEYLKQELKKYRVRDSRGGTKCKQTG